MAEQSGFFPDVSGDREYTTDFLALWIASIISNGVYDGDLAVAAGSNMQIVVPTGRAWINGYHYRNNGNLILAIDNADGVLNRKDTAVLRWDVNARSITAQVLKGTPASAAVAPAIVRTVEQYDLKLAEISVPAGTTAITQSLITDCRMDNSVCGIVTGVVDQIDTTTFYNQIADDLAGFKSSNEANFTSWSTEQRASFDTWLDGIKDVLDADTAGHLLNLVNQKPDKVIPAAAGNLAGIDAGGNLTDIGKQPSYFQQATDGLTAETDVADGDAIPFYDVSVPAHRKSTWANLKAKIKSALFGSVSGIPKLDGSGGVSAAARGTDYSLVNAPVIVSVPYTGWVQNGTTNAYEQSVAVDGLLATDDKRTRVEIVGSTDVAAQALIDTAAALISYVACNTTGYLYLRCDSGAPATTFSVAVIIAR